MVPWIRALTVVLLLNLVFLGLGLWGTTVPRELLRQRVRQAFAAGELVQEDYLPYDSRRGFHQYDECLILQMITNRAEASLEQAVGPLLYTRDSSYSDYCQTLHRLVVEGANPSGYLVSRYTRYWHGYMPLSAALLLALDLRTARLVLKAGAYLSLILLLAVSLASKRAPTVVIGASIATCGLLFWGLPYVGQAFSHVFGDILVVLGLCGLLIWRDKLSDVTCIIPFCAAYGAVVVYLEFLTGQLPTAAGFLFALTYAVAVCRDRSAARRNAWKFTGIGILAFGFGAAVTVVLKQMLAMAIFGPQPLGSLIENLKLYTGPMISEHPLPSFLLPFGRIFRKGTMLTYGSAPAASLLYTTSMLAWFVAGLLALRSHVGRASATTELADYLALVMGAAVIVGWILLFQHHTYVHAAFMVRIAIVPIALGWAALLWQTHVHWRVGSVRARAMPTALGASTASKIPRDR